MHTKEIRAYMTQLRDPAAMDWSGGPGFEAGLAIAG